MFKKKKKEQEEEAQEEPVKKGKLFGDPVAEVNF